MKVYKSVKYKIVGIHKSDGFYHIKSCLIGKIGKVKVTEELNNDYTTRGYYAGEFILTKVMKHPINSRQLKELYFLAVKLKRVC